MNNGDSEGYEHLIQPCHWLATGGHWSGTESRNHQHYIAVIPTTRYIDTDEVRRRELRRIAEQRGIKA
jgi:hypothetical protein